MVFVRALVCLTVVFAAWAFGTTESWSLTVLQILVGLAMASAVVNLVWVRSWRREQQMAEWLWCGPALALVIYIGLQAINASYHYQATTQSLIPQQAISWLPHSVEASATSQALTKFLTYVGLFWAVKVSFYRSAHVRMLLVVLVISGFVMAATAMLQRMSGTRQILWLRQPSQHCAFLGPFVNPDNFAAYLNLLIPAALTLGRHGKQMTVGRDRKSHPGLLFYFMAAVMIAVVVVSCSRAGVVLCVLLVAGWWTLEYARERRARKLLPALGLALAAAGVLLLTGFGPTRNKLQSVEMAVRHWQEFRLVPYRAALAMFGDHWLFGIGAGTFPYAFRYYQPDSLPGFWRYAHNDWLQYLTELGVVGFGLLTALGLMILRPQPAGNHSASRQQLVTACLLALAGVGLHALVDFPLHIPAVAGLAVTYAALVSGGDWSGG